MAPPSWPYCVHRAAPTPAICDFAASRMLSRDPRDPSDPLAPPEVAAGWPGRLLVAAQFVLLGALALAAWAGVRAVDWATAADDAGLLLRLLLAAVAIGAGVALGAAALRANRPGNFNIRPEPHASGQLVQAGPYRRIRHPMYSAVLLVGLGAALLAGAVPATGFVTGLAAPAALATLAALAVVLALKAGVEEQALSRRYPAYAAYVASTSRFVPGLY